MLERLARPFYSNSKDEVPQETKMTTDYEKFLKVIEKKPKLLESMEREEELERFKEKYHVDTKSPLVCPICSKYMQITKLWYDSSTEDRFVCKNCGGELRITTILGYTPKDFLKVAKKK